jgi:maltooligosyltrehalose trehalohydrolase
MPPKPNQPPRTPPRRLPVGAEVVPGGVHFRVWADRNERVDVVLGGQLHELCPEDDGYFSLLVGEARAGQLYAFRLNGRDDDFPDPVSRFQPDGPLGPSEIVDPSQFAWSDGAWRGVSREGQVIYEMHVGTFTPEGTFAAAAGQLGELANLGVTIVELMPLPEFPGCFGWGYDGVNLFAPTRLYGLPDDVRRFVDRAHAAGIGVILDVVYNHYGPGDKDFSAFSPRYYSERYTTDWGKAPNFDGPGSGPVREYFLANAGYWIDEFHLDGLRLDATQSIYDASEDHILSAMTRRVRAAAAGRATVLVAENETQHSEMVRAQDQGGFGLDALWNDDFHHSARVVLSGHNEAYYSDYRGAPQEFISAVKYGYLYQGQWCRWQKTPRGSPSFGLPPAAFVHYIQNHDQIANSARGLRCHALSSPGRYRAMTALLLLAPATPMLFQGQEFAASAPFYYFADLSPEVAARVREGRAKFLSRFPSIASPAMSARLPNPADPQTFHRCKLDFSERATHADEYALHCDLLRLRREDAVFHGQRPGAIDGAVLGPEAFVLRFFGGRGDDRLLVVNFGADFLFSPTPEPLLAPPVDSVWQALWSSEDPRYGGGGTARLHTDGNWRIAGQSAVVLGPKNAAGGDE